MCFLNPLLCGSTENIVIHLTLYVVVTDRLSEQVQDDLPIRQEASCPTFAKCI